MYVKVVPDDGSAPTLFQTPAGEPVDYGRHVMDRNPAEVEDWNAELGVAFHFLYARGDWSQPHTYEDADTGKTVHSWILTYAWWTVPNEGEIGVVTSGKIFLLGGDGKTIDRA